MSKRQTMQDYSAIRRAAYHTWPDDPAAQLEYAQARCAPRFAVLALAEIAQETTRHDQTAPAGIDYLWRAIIALVRDGPPSKDDGLYRYVLENLQQLGEATVDYSGPGHTRHSEYVDGRLELVPHTTGEIRDEAQGLPPSG